MRGGGWRSRCAWQHERADLEPLFVAPPLSDHHIEISVFDN